MCGVLSLRQVKGKGAFKVDTIITFHVSLCCEDILTGVALDEYHALVTLYFDTSVVQCLTLHLNEASLLSSMFTPDTSNLICYEK